MKHFIILGTLVAISSGCTILPLYDVRNVEVCEQKSYDTVCEGYEN